MRLSHAKVNHITNLLIEHLRNDDSVEFFQDDSDIRMEIARVINRTKVRDYPAKTGSDEKPEIK